MNIYLDIDGVLITKNSQPAKHVVEFLAYVTSNHQVYWLTTHCRGDAGVTVKYLKDKLPGEALPFLYKIKATGWHTLKTEAIDFSQDFRWFDDYAMESEKKILLDNNSLSRLNLVDLNKDSNALLVEDYKFRLQRV
jgi:hypothetical protein